MNRSTPGYRATNDPFWQGKSPDDIELPTVDSSNPSNLSCAAAFPYLATPNTIRVKLLSNSSPDSERVIRPLERPWIPLYFEDTSFRACAPQSQELRPADTAPIRELNAGSPSYCERAYPSVAPNSDTSDTNVVWPPILAPMVDIRNALKDDLGKRTYACAITSRGGKSVPPHQFPADCQ